MVKKERAWGCKNGCTAIRSIYFLGWRRTGDEGRLYNARPPRCECIIDRVENRRGAGRYDTSSVSVRSHTHTHRQNARGLCVLRRRQRKERSHGRKLRPPPNVTTESESKRRMTHALFFFFQVRKAMRGERNLLFNVVVKSLSGRRTS